MLNKKPSLLLGAHMSIAGGIPLAIDRGQSIGCTCIQIFTKSNRQWAAKPLDHVAIKEFKQKMQHSTIQAVVAHASYLINIGSPNPELNKKSVTALSDELKRIEQLEIPYLVFHPGAYVKGSEKECLTTIAKNIDIILSKNPGKSMLLLENTAGQGTNVGYTFEQLAKIYSQIEHKKRVGICFDTCHAFAAGYDFSTPEAYTKMWDSFDKVLGIKLLKVIHVNDSLKECGSRVDRHEDIGKGKMGLKSFELLFNDKRFSKIPKILETPKEDDMLDDVKNMETIKKLIK